MAHALPPAEAASLNLKIWNLSASVCQPCYITSHSELVIRVMLLSSLTLYLCRSPACSHVDKQGIRIHTLVQVSVYAPARQPQPSADIS